jgi:hypothetical protein
MSATVMIDPPLSYRHGWLIMTHLYYPPRVKARRKRKTVRANARRWPIASRGVLLAYQGSTTAHPASFWLLYELLSRQERAWSCDGALVPPHG